MIEFKIKDYIATGGEFNLDELNTFLRTTSSVLRTILLKPQSQILLYFDTIINTDFIYDTIYIIYPVSIIITELSK